MQINGLLHNDITWTNVDLLSSVWSCGIRLRAISQECSRYLSLIYVWVWKLLTEDYTCICQGTMGLITPRNTSPQGYVLAVQVFCWRQHNWGLCGRRCGWTSPGVDQMCTQVDCQWPLEEKWSKSMRYTVNATRWKKETTLGSTQKCEKKLWNASMATQKCWRVDHLAGFEQNCGISPLHQQWSLGTGDTATLHYAINV